MSPKFQILAETLLTPVKLFPECGFMSNSFMNVCMWEEWKRFNKICHLNQRPRWQVDKEAIGLSRVHQCSSTCNPPSWDYVSNLFLSIFMLLAVIQSIDNLQSSVRQALSQGSVCPSWWRANVLRRQVN